MSSDTKPLFFSSLEEMCDYFVNGDKIQQPAILDRLGKLLGLRLPETKKIPAAMRNAKRWCCYKLVPEGDHPKKPPYSPVTGTQIGATGEYKEHFVTFDEARTAVWRYGLSGMSFVLLEGDDLVGIDLDGAVTNGVIHHEVQNWLKFFPGSYVEYSPSGNGIHIFCQGKLGKSISGALPGGDGATVEMYAWDRHLTVTGNVIRTVDELCDQQVSVDKLIAYLGKTNTAVSEKGAAEMFPEQAQAIYAKLLGSLKDAVPGTRNTSLNKAAFFAGQIHEANLLNKDEDATKREIYNAALRAWDGDVPDEDLNTASNAWSSGLREPIARLESNDILCGIGLLDESVRAAEAVLFKLGGKYFESNGRLVMPRFARDAGKKDLVKLDPAVQRDQDSTILVDASSATIFRDLDKHGHFVKIVEKNGEFTRKKIGPPAELPKHILDRTMNFPNEVPFPRLDMLVNTPVLLPSGEVHDAPGELDEGVLFLDPQFKYARVPERPSHDDARAALRKFEPIFCRFPFVKERDDQPWQETPSYAVVLAACLTIVARSALQVAVPLFSIKAPKQRSGKTKIADASTRAMTGHKATTIHYRDEEEFGKTLLPLLLHHDRVVLVDNIDRPFRSAKFAPLVTDNSLTDRWLGRSESIKLYNRAVFFATGNNLVITGDLGWRSLLVSIDANMEHPESRRFDFKPEDRALAAHPELVIAALTALRAYVLVKRPWQLARGRWGGFEEWDHLVSGCLVWLGYADPKLTQETVIEDDPVREANVQLLETWHGEFGNDAVRLRNIERNRQSPTRQELLNAKGEWDAREIGWRLRHLRDRVENGYKLVKGTGRGGLKEHYWRVISLEERPPSTEKLPF